MTAKQQQLQGRAQLQDDTGCWIWQGQIANSGYGRIKEVRNKEVVMISAQVASYQAYIGPVPSGFLVKQSCGNRLCINPQHLELMKVP